MSTIADCICDVNWCSTVLKIGYLDTSVQLVPEVGFKLFFFPDCSFFKSVEQALGVLYFFTAQLFRCLNVFVLCWNVMSSCNLYFLKRMEVIVRLFK